MREWENRVKAILSQLKNEKGQLYGYLSWLVATFGSDNNAI